MRIKTNANRTVIIRTCTLYSIFTIESQSMRRLIHALVRFRACIRTTHRHRVGAAHLPCANTGVRTIEMASSTCQVMKRLSAGAMASTASLTLCF